MNCRKIHIFYIFLLFLASNFALAQEDVKIELSKKNILLDENFTIKVIISNTDKSAISAFPEFPNFTKGAKQKVFSKNPLGYTITQIYTPIKEGNFKIPSFILTINNKDYTTDSFNLIINSAEDNSEEANETISPEKAKNNAEEAMRHRAFSQINCTRELFACRHGSRAVLKIQRPSIVSI